MEIDTSPRLASNSWYPYLSLSSTGIMVMHHHTSVGRHCFSALAILIMAQGEFDDISNVNE